MIKYDYIIIGGSGFIGRQLLTNFITLKKKFLVLDVIKPDLDCEYQYCDITNQKLLLSKFSKSYKVFFLAAAHSDDCEVSQYYKVNHEGAKNVIKAVLANEIKEIIFISSVAVYGKDQDISDTDLLPNNDYGKSKLLAEKELRLWKDKDQSRILKIIRPTAVFGKGSKGNTNRFFNTVIKNRFVFIGNKTTKKSLCYVNNLVDFMIYCSNLEKNFITNYVDKPDLELNVIVKVINDNKKKFNIVNFSLINIPFKLFKFLFNLFQKTGLKKYFLKDITNERINRINSDTIFTGINKNLTFKPKFSIIDALIIEVQKYESY